MSKADESKRDGGCLPRLVRRDLVWHPGPANDGGGTADTDVSPWWSFSPRWFDGELLLVIVERNDGPEVSCVRVYADDGMVAFANPATGDFDFGWSDTDVAWWAKLDECLPTNATAHTQEGRERGPDNQKD